MSGRSYRPGALALVLQIVIVDLQSVFSERKKNLVSDSYATVRIAAAELLHDVFRSLGSERRFWRAPAGWLVDRCEWGRRGRLRVDHAHPALLDTSE